MSELESRLTELGRELELPPAPDVAPAVLAGLERAPRRPSPWRLAVVAVAVVAIAIGAAFAVPQARSTILRWFHLRGVTVERVQTLPRAVERSSAAGLGRPLSRKDAERVVGFRLALPPLPRGESQVVYVLDDALATVLVKSEGRPAMLSEFRAPGFDVFKKSAAGKTVIESVQVNGREGLWLEGGPHTLTYIDRSGRFRERTVLIHGNVLFWERDGLTLRLEGHLTKREALEIARNTR